MNSTIKSGESHKPNLAIGAVICSGSIVAIKSRTFNNLARILSKGVNLGRASEIDKAVIFSCYLYVLGYTQEASNLLDSFIYEGSHDDEREDLWGSVGKGILLRAFVFHEQSDFERELHLVKIISEHDIMTDRCSRRELLQEIIPGHEANLKIALEETPKYKCEIYAQEILTFIYFFEMLPQFKGVTESQLMEDVLQKIDKCRFLLRDALAEK